MATRYSKKKDGKKKLSQNFTVAEMACNDGSDLILINDKFVKSKLQKIRDHFKKAIIINSAYRTKTYNRKVGGASNSQHIKGNAFDIYVKGVNVKEVAKYAESIAIKGIGLYLKSNFVHIDSRSIKYFWQENESGSQVSKKTFGGNPAYFPTLKKGSTGSYVKKLQTKLKNKGYKLTIDSIFGSATQNAVKKFQKANKLQQDGIVGSKTWKKLYK